MSVPDRLLTVAEVADLLRVSVQTFQKSSFRRKLDATGFPKTKLRGRWSASQIADWMAGKSPEACAPQATADDQDQEAQRKENQRAERRAWLAQQASAA